VLRIDATAGLAALVERYQNRRIRHLLGQIAADGSQKIPIRIVPVLRADLAEGRVARGATRAVATQSLEDAVDTVLATLGLTEPQVRSVVTHQARELADGA